MVHSILAGILGILSAVTIGQFVVAEPTPQLGQSFPAISPWTYFGGSDDQIRTISSSTQVVVGDDATSTDSALETPSLTITELTSADCLGTNANGVVQVGTCTGGGGLTEDASTTLAINGVAQGIAEILDFSGTDFAITESPTGDFDISIDDGIARDSELYTDADIDGTEAAFSGWDKDASDDFDGAFSSLTGIPSGLSDGDDDTQLSEEQVEDYVGGMLNGTETLIDVTYQDASNNINFVVNDDLSLYDNTSSGFLTGNQTITLSGDVTGSGATSITTSLGTGVVADNEIDYTAVTLDDFTNDAGFITSADDSVSGSELDGVFSTNGILKRTGANTYTTVSDTLHDAVTLSGTPDYLTLSGQTITLDQIDLAADVSGTLAASNIDGSIARDTELHDAITIVGEDYLSLSTQQITANAINPDNLANADFGDFSCNGTTCSLDVSTGGAAALTELNDVTLTSTSTGDILYQNGSGQFVNLGIGTTDQVLTVSGGLPTWSDIAAGGGSGAGWATTTDDEEVTYSSPVNPVYVGGSASTTATHIFDYRDSSITLASTSNSNATATIESSNNAQALRFGDQGGEGIEADFGENNTVTWRSFTDITSWVFDNAITITANLAANTVDAIDEIASSLRSGSDTTLVTGTAGTSGNLVEWNADGDAVDSGVAATDVLTGNETITLSGDITGSGATSITTVLSADSVSDDEIDYTSVTLNDFTNDAGFVTSADDSVSGSELDGVFSTTGFLQRTGPNTYTTATCVDITGSADLCDGSDDGAQALGDIGDVDGSPSSNDILYWDGNSWANTATTSWTDGLANAGGETYSGTHDFTGATLAREEKLLSVTVSSTSVEFVSGGSLPVGSDKDAVTLTEYRCWVEGGTSVVLNLSDGTNDTETITCGTSVTSDTNVSTNDSFSADEKMYLEFGTITGTVDYVHFTAYGTVSR